MRTFVATALLALAYATPARADSFTVTGRLTGDDRPENPEGLVIDVAVNVVDDRASWTVDLDSLAHPDARLHLFAFNLDLDGAVPAFSDLTPDNAGGKTWRPVSGTNVPGSGGADFDFAVRLGGGGSPHPNRVDNATDLTFDMTLDGGTFWSRAMFAGAGLATGGGIPALGAPMGAHLQSLVQGPLNDTDSGFASGGWDDPGGSGGDPIPEPGTLALCALGVATVVFARRRGTPTG